MILKENRNSKECSLLELNIFKNFVQTSTYGVYSSRTGTVSFIIQGEERCEIKWRREIRIRDANKNYVSSNLWLLLH